MITTVAGYWLILGTLFGLCIWKVYLGAIICSVVGFSFLEMLVYTNVPVILSVVVTYFLGQQILQLFNNKKNGFDKRLRKVVVLWNKYGFISAAILAPVLLGIPVFITIGLRLKEPFSKLFFSVLTMSVLWTSLLYIFTDYLSLTEYFDVSSYL
ncbi:hypothetical protein [Flammeovirga kamogawensis]|uniref:Uncharacterized protein n=1 Tax=Flammeovirga kamogawensis TaxID=373891 RepID=A0ABX8GVD6_9BACT|nr:hypothetical protein [Flammeovirga kamogawensis]MBB6460986.1 nitrogen fixation/metabolism regulation signal transduction histidine kinase [Flammeovirga kamogawensis]QWG07558.1 hypothetical protein KM029_01070 [Flammeovirga kamogawensis]TRX69370.1 hypothetical protein EO216_15010 [Flammeovirga kamogawensis]